MPIVKGVSAKSYCAFKVCVRAQRVGGVICI
jgi:hypothetical protein